MKYGWTAEEAIVVATAFGLLGSFLDLFVRLLNGQFNRWAQKHVENGEYNKLAFDAFWGPELLAFVCRAIPMFLIIYFGGGAMNSIMAAMPQWLVNGLNAVGGVLPGVGLMLCLAFIGTTELLPFYIMGYFMSLTLGWNMVVLVIFGVCFAFLYLQFTKTGNEEEESDFSWADIKNAQLPEDSVLTKADHFKCWWRTLVFFRNSTCLEYFYATGYAFVFLPAYKKIYKDNDEGLKEALTRCLEPYITEPDVGGCIYGMVLAMEEQKAKGEDIDGNMISTMKTSLMGPMAGVGDSILWGPIFAATKAMMIPIAMAGHWYAVLGLEVLVFCAHIIMYFSHMLGYKMGGQAMIAFLQNGLIKRAMSCVSVLGFYMLGVMSSSYVKINAALSVSDAYGTTYTLQSVFDTIAPGLLPLIFCLASYAYLRKGGKFLRLLLICLVVFLVLGSVGILA